MNVGHAVMKGSKLGAIFGLGVGLGACAGPPVAADDWAAGTEAVGATQAALRTPVCLTAPADIPAALAVPADQCLAAEALGSGVQIYTCTAGAWVLKAPEANLLDAHGRFVGNHFLGPTWQWRDGSKIKGAPVARVAAPVPAQDVAWLLLSVASADGAGKLADVKNIQRVHTKGGVAPVGACTEGAETRVPYTADYLFYHLRTCAP